MRFSLSQYALTLASGMFALVLAAGCKKDQKKEPTPEGAPAPSNPGGDVHRRERRAGRPRGLVQGRDTVGGYKMLLPGRVIYNENTSSTSNVSQEAKGSLLTHATQDPEKETTVRGVSYLPAAGQKPGTTPDEYYATFLAGRATFLTLNEVLVKSPVTLGGRPALKLVFKEKITYTPLPDDDPEFAKEELERRKKRDAKRTTYFLTANNNRVVQIQINTLGEPDAGFLNTIIQSFRFL